MLLTNLPSFDELKGFLWSLGMVQARLAPFFLLIPFMNRSMVPRTIMFAFAAGVGLLVVPILPPSAHAWPEGLPLIALILKESFLGFVLGLLVAVPFWAFEAAGFIIDNQRGASMASTINPMTGHDSSPLGLAFNFAFITFFLVSGGMSLLLGLVYDSYRLWPPLEFWPAIHEGSATLLFVQLNRLVLLGLMLAAPVLAAMFLSEVGLALVSRFAPQLQVFFLAMPIKSALALFVLVVYSGTMFDFAGGPMREIATWVDRLDPLFRGPR